MPVLVLNVTTLKAQLVLRLGDLTLTLKTAAYDETTGDVMFTVTTVGLPQTLTGWLTDMAATVFSWQELPFTW